MKIDSHQHFWNYDPQNYGWINSEMSVLKRDFLPADLLQELNQNGLDGSVAVQASQTEFETEYLLGFARNYEFVKAVVGWVDLRSKNIDERLQHYQGAPKLAGFRHVVQDEPDENFMLRKDFQNGISLLEKYGFTYDILIFPNQLEAALQTIKNFPNQKFVVDHIAKPRIKEGIIEPWGHLMGQIAACDNVWCKISGMVTEADWQNWSKDDFTPYLDLVLGAFGTDRIMFGSDWPVCLLAGKYEEVKGVVDDYFQGFSDNEKSKIFGENAAAFYEII